MMIIIFIFFMFLATSYSLHRSSQTKLFDSKLLFNDSDLPSMVYMGDQLLMQPVTDTVDPSAIGSDHFMNQLDILRKCQKFYGGIGIAAPQIGWRARVFSMGDVDVIATTPSKR